MLDRRASHERRARLADHALRRRDYGSVLGECSAHNGGGATLLDCPWAEGGMVLQPLGWHVRGISDNFFGVLVLARAKRRPPTDACRSAGESRHPQARPSPRLTAANQLIAARRALFGHPRMNVEGLHLMRGVVRGNITNAAIDGMIITFIP
jgi:hypothetical protein